MHTSLVVCFVAKMQTLIVGVDIIDLRFELVATSIAEVAIAKPQILVWKLSFSAFFLS